jgi:hypothetical protein
MLVTHANTNGVWPNFLVWSPPRRGFMPPHLKTKPSLIVSYPKGLVTQVKILTVQNIL